MKRAFLLALGAGLIAAMLLRDRIAALWAPDPFAAEGVVTVRTRGLGVDAVLRPDPPRQRGTTLHLAVTDPSGTPVLGAEVAVEAMMPAMGAMPEMRSRADVVEAGGGRYAATFDLEMGGGWTLIVDLTAGDRTANVRYAFTVGTPGLDALPSGAPALPTPPADVVPDHAFSEPARAALIGALHAYDVLRRALLADTLDGIGEASRGLARDLRRAAQAERSLPDVIARHLTAASQAAEAMASTDTIDAGRDAMIPLSRHLIALAAADERLAEGLRVKACPMVAGVPRWIEPADGAVGNPYMGRAMPGCAIDAAWRNVDDVTKAPSGSGSTADGAIFVDPVRRQKFGVTTEEVALRSVATRVDAYGVVTVDERLRERVTVRTAGFVERLLVEEEGVAVRDGQPLLELYSPEVYTAQHELLLGARGAADIAQLRDAPRTKLSLLGVADADIDAILREGTPRRAVPVRAPVGGVVLAKDVVQGQAVSPGRALFEVAPLDRLWVEAAVHEDDLPRVAVGQAARIELPAPGVERDGRVALIEPRVDPTTRSATVRVEVDNTDGSLLPGMVATVRLRRELGPTVAVPRDAVVYAGSWRLVFVDQGGGVLAPREVQTGASGDGWLQIVDGLRPGERVVTSGVFLVAAESRLRSAVRYWSSE